MKKKKLYRLRLVIDPITLEEHRVDNEPYDLDNSKPWPLGTFDTEREAIAQRNHMVMIEPPATGDPKRDKAISSDRASRLQTVKRTVFRREDSHSERRRKVGTFGR